jgi:hypothetical protein
LLEVFLGVERLQVCDEAFGHALPKLMKKLGAKLVIVSTPEKGGPPDEQLPPDKQYNVPVMSGLERLAGYVFPRVLGSYDFKGSAAAQDCEAQVPDKDLIGTDGWK